MEAERRGVEGNRGGVVEGRGAGEAFRRARKAKARRKAGGVNKRRDRESLGKRWRRGGIFRGGLEENTGLLKGRAGGGVNKRREQGS